MIGSISFQQQEEHQAAAVLQALCRRLLVWVAVVNSAAARIIQGRARGFLTRLRLSRDEATGQSYGSEDLRDEIEECSWSWQFDNL